jgi:LacI family transcriptional regulator
MPITIQQLAKAAGVSIATVSRALNNSGHPVNEETRKKILSLAEEFGYRPNQTARTLRMDRSGMIGIVADDITSYFTPIIIRGIQDYLKGQGLFCIIINTDWDPENEKRAVQELLERSVDGVIFVESWRQTANTDLNIADKPYVFVHRLFPATHEHSVVPDEIYGSRLAVNHLIKLGHRRIGFINGPENYYASSDRLIGYRQELAANKIRVDESLIEFGDWEVSSGTQSAQKLLEMINPPSAIFAANDLMALGALNTAQSLGLSVPGDLAIVGYDDREIASLVKPSITTVSLPCYEMGLSAASMLHSILKDEEIAEEIHIKGQLIVRESCGAENKTTESLKLRNRRARH